MNLTTHLAKHLRDLHFGGNWTWVNMKDSLDGVDWRQATQKVGDLNTIATLVFHINYYTTAQIKVLRGGPLESSDKFAFAHPPIESQADWEALLGRVWKEAEELAGLIENLPVERLFEVFVEEKYGTYLRNLMGSIEHGHYHLGQIVLIKKLLAANA